MAAIQGDFKEFNFASAASIAAVFVELFVIDCVLSEARDACIECPCARTVQDFYITDCDKLDSSDAHMNEWLPDLRMIWVLPRYLRYRTVQSFGYSPIRFECALKTEEGGVKISGYLHANFVVGRPE